jgi:hypothetical protein
MRTTNIQIGINLRNRSAKIIAAKTAIKNSPLFLDSKLELVNFKINLSFPLLLYYTVGQGPHQFFLYLISAY